MANSTPGTPTTSGQRKRARTEAERTKSLKCSNAFFHLGIILTITGILFTILAMATNSLFYVDIYRNSNNEHINIPFGIFSSYGYGVTNKNESVVYEHPLESGNASMTASRALVLIGFFAAVIAALIHILFCVKEEMRRRKIIFVEMIFLLIAMVAILASLSFAEMQREYVHDDSSEPIARFMEQNKLADSAEVYKEQREISDNAPIESQSNPKSDVIFTQVMTSMRFSFYAMIVATFMFLLAFLFALIYFVRLCERINKEERELRENLTKPENMEPNTAVV